MSNPLYDNPPTLPYPFPYSSFFLALTEARTLGILPTVGRPYGLCLMTLPDNNSQDNTATATATAAATIGKGTEQRQEKGSSAAATTTAASRLKAQMTGPGSGTNPPTPPRFPPGRRPRNRVLSSVDGR